MYRRFLDPAEFFFFFNDTATTEIYTLSLHDALPIYQRARVLGLILQLDQRADRGQEGAQDRATGDPAGEASGEPARPQPAEADQERPGQREREHQPAVGRAAHPRSSDISSMSIGSRLRYIATMIPRPITTSQAAITITISANT